MAEQHDRSRAQENRFAGAMGGQRSPASGAFWKRKGDVRSKRWLVEMKRTNNKRSITIKFDDLRKIYSEATGEGRLPALGFELNGRNYVILTEADFLEECAP